MTILLFVIVGGGGLATIPAILYRVSKRRNLNSHQIGMILAGGFGLTWFAASTLPFLVAENRSDLTSILLLFNVSHAALVALFAYGFARLLKLNLPH